jgi:hypothetical protein
MDTEVAIQRDVRYCSKAPIDGGFPRGAPVKSCVTVGK